MGKSKKRSNKKNQRNQPEVRRHSLKFHENYRADNYNVRYQYNDWNRRLYHNVDDRYNRFHYFAPRKEREPSPFNGSEEFTQRKIQETSDMIKRQLMSPDNCLPCTPSALKLLEEKSSVEATSSMHSSPKQNKQTKFKHKRKRTVELLNNKSPQVTYNVQEIHDQIMNHISKLNYGRKQNLINSDTSGYDEAIQQIHKQKSLELSKALRHMSHQEKPEASEIVNSIIPDFAIKFEELPIHIIRALSSSFEHIDRDIGIVDENTPYDLRNQCMSELDQSEDADSIDIKQEDLVETTAKLEPEDVIVLQDSENEERLCSVEVKNEISYGDEINGNNQGHTEGYSSTGTMDVTTSQNHLENPIQDGVPNIDNHLTVELINGKESSNESLIPNDIITPPLNCQNSIKLKDMLGNDSTEANDKTVTNNENSAIPPLPLIRINSNLFKSPSDTECHEIELLHNHSLISEVPEENLCNIPNVEVPEKEIEELLSVETHSNSRNSNESYSALKNNKSTNNNDTQDLKKNVYISVNVKRRKKPVNLKEVTEMMLEFDWEIEKLTKLRQSIIADLNKNSEQKQKQKQVKRKSNQKGNNNSKKQKTNSNSPMETPKNPIENTADFNLERSRLFDVVVIFKVLTQFNTLLAGTLEGLIQCFDLSHAVTRGTQGSVKIYSTRITCLEYVHVRNEHLIFTATTEEPEITILNYNTLTVTKRIRLEDGVQAMCANWNYLFTGGCRGFLTRFNWETNKKEYEDPISTSDKIVDLKATTEGARKVLVILLSDPKGSCQIQVRDALTGLHMRIVGDFLKAVSLVLHLHDVIVSSAEGINMYDFCDGQFKAKLTPLNVASNLCFLDNLLLAQYHNGIYVYDFKRKQRLGTVTFRNISAFLILKNKIVIGTTTRNLRTLTIPQEYLDRCEKI